MIPPKASATNASAACRSRWLVAQLDWSNAVIEEDDRKDYGERRYRVIGYIGDRLHAVIFTPRAGKVHVISLRKANKREVKQHEQKAKP